MRCFVVLVTALLGCTNPSPFTAKCQKSIVEIEGTPRPTVIINGRSFNYDPRERIGVSAYQRGLRTKQMIVRGPEPQDDRWRIRRTTDPVLALARICVSEEGFDGDRGCKAIGEVARNVRSRSCDNTLLRFQRHTPITQCKLRTGELVQVGPHEKIDGAQETPLSALRRMSRYVTGLVEPIKPRQHWTSTLHASTVQPTGWIECTTDNGQECHGTWRNYTERWEEILGLAKELISRRVPVCPRANRYHGPVIAWGGEMDRKFAERRGLVEIDCGDTANIFYARPRATPPAVQSARRRLRSQQSDEYRIALEQELGRPPHRASDG